MQYNVGKGRDVNCVENSKREVLRWRRRESVVIGGGEWRGAVSRGM